MPTQGTAYDAETVYALADAVEARCRAEGVKCRSDAELTVYHSTALPGVPLRTLAVVLLEFCKDVTPEACVAAFELFDRCQRRRPGGVADELMMHRLFVGCAAVAIKSVQEFFPPNTVVAARMGIARWEINRLEATVLHDLDWRVVVTLEQLDRIVIRHLEEMGQPCAPDNMSVAGTLPTPAHSSAAASVDEMSPSSLPADDRDGGLPSPISMEW
eukprot:CAMPEP_0174826752 /NCGR_PEP_ID=MMETSP1114-20130205/197_1 /TAXON_ID=312471 /ORGANISM="Neobodo designis, Strain CCAP 1951/1" /LENGTH=214 /DNA_ID=CAMNT_0016060313 /DNA_START=92 /DNA_END=736 /DNA_ORIENTATION=+